MHWITRLLRGVNIGLYLIIIGSLVAGSSQILSTVPSEAARRYTRPVEFDFVNWTVDALAIKLGQASIDSPYYFSETSRHQLASDYLKLIDEILKDENQLNLTFADPTIQDPEAASAPLRESLDRLYARQRQLGPLAESILQEQISE